MLNNIEEIKDFCFDRLKDVYAHNPKASLQKVNYRETIRDSLEELSDDEKLMVLREDPEYWKNGLRPSEITQIRDMIFLEDLLLDLLLNNVALAWEEKLEEDKKNAERAAEADAELKAEYDDKGPHYDPLFRRNRK